MTRQPHADLPSPGELVAELGRLSQEVDRALRFVREQAEHYAKAEDAYRMARAKLQLEAEAGLREHHGIDKPTVDEKRAYVDLNTSKERVAAHLADGLLKAGFEAVKSRRAQLSALQSASNAVRAELELSRTGP